MKEIPGSRKRNAPIESTRWRRRKAQVRAAMLQKHLALARCSVMAAGTVVEGGCVMAAMAELKRVEDG